MKKLFVFLIIIASALFAQEKAKAPKIYSPNRFYNFGDLREGQVVHHTFIVKNKGTDTLKIYKVRSSCGCTVAKLKKQTIAPGDSTFIDVTFNSKNRQGLQKKYVYVFSNDPVLPKLEFHLRAEVFPKNANVKLLKEGPRLKLQTHQIQLGKVKKGEKKTVKIKYANVGKKTLKIYSALPSSKNIKVFPSRYQLEPGKTGILEIDVDTSGLQGITSRTVVIKTNDTLEPLQIITIFVEIKKDKK